MSLRLVIGPAGARKVGSLLDAHAAASRAGRTAWFVVPSSADVEPFQRELAGLQAPPGQLARSGAPFGAVLTEARLVDRLLRRLGTGQTILTPEHRRAVALAAIHGTELTALRPAARSGWLADELIRLAEELASTGDLGGSAEAGLQAWSARTSDRRGDELAALLRADSAILQRLDESASSRQVDRARAAAIIGAALRADPAAGLDLHIVFQGFDDLDPVQRTLVLALGRSQARVVISLPYEEGREALAAARPLVEVLGAEAGPDGVEYLAATPAGDAPSVLEHLAMRLYEHEVHVAPPPSTAVPLVAPEPAPFDLGPLVRYDDENELVGESEGESVSAAGLSELGLDAEAIADPPDAGPGTRPDDSAAEVDVVTSPVVELCGGGPDEEAALIAEHVAALISCGYRPERIAVVVDQPAGPGPALAAALRRAGVPVHLVARRRPARLWPSVAAIVGLLRAAGEAGEARHLVDWISGPGGPGGAETFDAAIRRRGATGVWDALKVWRSLQHERMVEIDDLRAAARSRERDRLQADPDRGADVDEADDVAQLDVTPSLEALVASLMRTRLADAMAAMTIPTPEQERDLRAVGSILSMLDGLVRLAADAPDLGLGLTELTTLIERAPAPADREPPGSVAIVDPLDIRTRYPEVVVVARTVRTSYPAAEPIRQLLTRSDRAALGKHHDWPAPSRPDHAARQRYLAYEVVARPSRQLVLAWHRGNGDGKPVEPSPLLAEVRRVVPVVVPVVALAAGAAPRRAATADRRARLDAARGGPRYRERTLDRSPLLAAQDRDRYAVGALQAASRCAAQWFVQHHLRPQPLSPDAAPLTAGRIRHDLLADIVRTAVTGGAALEPSSAPILRAALEEAAARLAAKAKDETQAERLMRERVVAEVDATIPGLCGDRRLAHQPREFELPFGTAPREAQGGPTDDSLPGASTGDGDGNDDDARPPVVVERAGERLVLAGRIDRLDYDPGTGELVVVDYKGANVDAFKGAGWVEGRELQAGLYALAAEELVGGQARTVASLYQPVPGPANQPPRGATSTDLPGRSSVLRNDRLSPEAWDELLDALVQLAADAQRGIDDGVIAPVPLRCSAGGCRFPWLCREVQA